MRQLTSLPPFRCCQQAESFFAVWAEFKYVIGVFNFFLHQNTEPVAFQLLQRFNLPLTVSAGVHWSKSLSIVQIASSWHRIAMKTKLTSFSSYVPYQSHTLEIEFLEI